jgi:hypothetical protein
MSKPVSVPSVVQLHILSTHMGHEKETITINDDDPERRKLLAKRIDTLIKDGFSILLSDGRSVRGYDAKTNDWLVLSANRKEAKKGITVRANAEKSGPANAVAPVAGG